MIWIITYDIHDDRARSKVATILESWGIRVQYSVFEVKLNRSEFQLLEKELKPWVNAEQGDSIRWYAQCQDCLSKQHNLGKEPENFHQQGYIII